MKCPLFLDIKLLRGRILIFEDAPGFYLLSIIFAFCLLNSIYESGIGTRITQLHIFVLIHFNHYTAVVQNFMYFWHR